MNVVVIAIAVVFGIVFWGWIPFALWQSRNHYCKHQRRYEEPKRWIWMEDADE